MAWVRDDTSRLERKIAVRQIKARNAPLYDFELVERFDIAQFRDPGQEDRLTWPSEDEYNSILNTLARSQALPSSSTEQKKVHFENEPIITKDETIPPQESEQTTPTMNDGEVDFSKVSVPSRKAVSLLRNHKVDDESV
jgi:hypothetical protein